MGGTQVASGDTPFFFLPAAPGYVCDIAGASRYRLMNYSVAGEDGNYELSCQLPVAT
ncbi:MAG TPA: hypothetical protein VNY82_02340 [Steroidobacteraceae bacterium]|nr:hypothetical protein [Steroidobacteraceae bacterium]